MSENTSVSSDWLRREGYLEGGIACVLGKQARSIYNITHTNGLGKTPI